MILRDLLMHGMIAAATIAIIIIVLKAETP